MIIKACLVSLSLVPQATGQKTGNRVETRVREGHQGASSDVDGLLRRDHARVVVA